MPAFRWKFGRWARAPSAPDLLIRAAFIPAAAILASPPEIERPAPPFVVVGEPDAGGALSAASFAAESIGFVLQKKRRRRLCFGELGLASPEQVRERAADGFGIPRRPAKTGNHWSLILTPI